VSQSAALLGSEQSAIQLAIRRPWRNRSRASIHGCVTLSIGILSTVRSNVPTALRSCDGLTGVNQADRVHCI
jgi:hypothetical protein